MQRAPSINLLAATCLALVGTGACGGSTSTQPASPIPAPADSAAAAAEPIGSPLELVPANAYLVVAGDSPAHLAEAIGWDALRSLEPVGRTADGIGQALGHDLLSLSGLTALGIDIEQPFGVAAVPGERDAALIFARLASVKTFSEELEAIAARQDREVEREQTGAATVLSFATDGSDGDPPQATRTYFVLRGDHLLVAESAALGETVAHARASESLAATSAYGRATDAMGSGGGIFGFVNLAHILGDQLAGLQGPAQLVGLVLDQIGFAGIAFAADLRGETIGLRLALPAREDGPPPVLKAGERVPAIIRGLDRQPLVLASLHMDVDALLARAQRIAGPDGLRHAKAMAGQAFAIDVDEELLPLLTGEVGVAWSGDIEFYGPEAASDEPSFDPFDLHVTLGVTDTAAAAALLERVSESPLLDSQVEPRADGGITIPLPMWKPLHVAAKAGTIAATTDPELLSRLDDDGDTSFAAHAEAASHGELLLRSDAAAVSSIAIESLALLLLGNQIDPGVLELGEALPGPDTDAYRSSQGELEEAETALEEVVTAAQKAQGELATVVNDYGVISLSFRAAPGMVTAEGGHFLPPGSTLASQLARHVEAYAVLNQHEREAFALTSRRMQLLHELEQMRAEENDE